MTQTYEFTFICTWVRLTSKSFKPRYIRNSSSFLLLKEQAGTKRDKLTVDACTRRINSLLFKVKLGLPMTKVLYMWLCHNHAFNMIRWDPFEWLAPVLWTFAELHVEGWMYALNLALEVLGMSFTSCVNGWRCDTDNVIDMVSSFLSGTWQVVLSLLEKLEVLCLIRKWLYLDIFVLNKRINTLCCHW